MLHTRDWLLGEAANRLSKRGRRHGVDWALATANRNFIMHQHDAIDSEQTWLTLSLDTSCGSPAGTSAGWA